MLRLKFDSKKIVFSLGALLLVLLTVSQDVSARSLFRGGRGGGRGGNRVAARRVGRLNAFNQNRFFFNNRNFFNRFYNPFFFASHFNPFIDSSFMGHGNVAGVDPRFSNGFDPSTNGIGRDGSACGASFNRYNCDNVQKEWRCWSELSGFSLVANGENKCHAMANIQYATCRQGVDANIITTIPISCVRTWNGALRQMGDFSDSTTYAPGEVVVNVPTQFWEQTRAWLAAKGYASVKNAFSGRPFWTLSVAPGQEQAVCEAMIAWKPNWITSCSPQLFVRDGAVATTATAGGGY